MIISSSVSSSISSSTRVKKIESTPCGDERLSVSSKLLIQLPEQARQIPGHNHQTLMMRSSQPLLLSALTNAPNCSALLHAAVTGTVVGSEKPGNDQSMALRCILQRSQSSLYSVGARSSENEDDSGNLPDAGSLQKYALIPNSVTVANLLEFVLRQLNIKEAASDCKANIVLPGWKTLALNEICSNTENTTVASLLGNVSNIAVLLIKLPVELPPPMKVTAIQRLMRALLPKHTEDRAVQVDWLLKSGCPMGETDLLAYLSAREHFVFTEAARVNFAVWRRHLRCLAAQADMDFHSDIGAVDVVGNATAEEGEMSSSVAEGPDVSSMDASEAAPNEEGMNEDSCYGDDGDDWDADEDSRSSAQALLERLSHLSRVPRHPANSAVVHIAGKENLGGIEASTTDRGLPPPMLTKATTAEAAKSSSSLISQVPPPRHRLFICPHAEIPVLEKHFAVNAHPDATDCRRIAEELNSMPFRCNERRQMQAKNVRLWFKNRRARARKGDPVAPSSKAVAAAAAASFSPAAGTSGSHHHPLLLPLLPQPPSLLAKPVTQSLHQQPAAAQLPQIRLPMLSGVSGSSAAASS